MKRSFFTIVKQGRLGARLTLGRSPILLKPGIHLRIPLIHSLEKIDMRESTVSIGTPNKEEEKNEKKQQEEKHGDKEDIYKKYKLQCFTSDNVPVDISGSLFYQVQDAMKCCFNVNDYKTRIQEIGTSAVRSIIGTFEYDDIISDRNKINKKLREVIGDSIKEWGISCTKFEVQSFEPSNYQIRKQLEQQMEAERSRRKNLLDTEASVTVSEGLKRKTILESEGSLQRTLNDVKGDYERVVKEAESHKIALKLEADGIKQQLDIISGSLGNDTEKAMKMLLELKRFEQFKAIANGKNNTVYFTSDSKLANGFLTDFLEKNKSNGRQ